MINRDCRCPGCGVCDAAEAIDPLKKERTVLRKSLKEEKQRYDELSRIANGYINTLHAAEEENRRLRGVLYRISIGMDVQPFDATAAQVEGYFRGIAEATLKKGG